MNDLTRFVLGLMMLAGVIVVVLGFILSSVSYDSPVWRKTGMQVSLMGAVLVAVSAIIYGVSL